MRLIRALMGSGQSLLSALCPTYMKIPKSLKIGGQVYKIILKDMDSDGGSGKAGMNYLVKNEIYINISKEYHRSQQEQTLIHEIIEALNYLHEYKLEHPTISSFAENIYQVLKDNHLNFS